MIMLRFSGGKNQEILTVFKSFELWSHAVQGHHRAGSLRTTYSIRSTSSQVSDATPINGGLITSLNPQASLHVKRSLSDMSSIQGSPLGLKSTEQYSTPRGITSGPTSISDLAETKQTLPVEPLIKALDALYSSQRPFQGVYMALSPSQRHVRHSSVVQLFSNTETRRRVAIRFYLMSACYDREVAMLSKPGVKNISVEHIQVGSSMAGPGGYTWPPCIVMDAGENLSTFIRRAPKRDEATACAVMAEVATLIEALHDIGWAHRNLKPSNVLFIADSDSWVLCDLERSARIGTVPVISLEAPLFSPGSFYFLAWPMLSVLPWVG
jgi:hypothetical protein